MAAENDTAFYSRFLPFIAFKERRALQVGCEIPRRRSVCSTPATPGIPMTADNPYRTFVDDFRRLLTDTKPLDVGTLVPPTRRGASRRA